MRAFRDVLAVDAAAGTVEAEGMVTYEDLVDACLARGVMPAVVPQLKTITLGGALAGVGIEASSHRHGLVHDTALEIEVLLGDGRIVTCTPDNEHADLFFGFPNSYGTLGYALRVKAKAVPVQPYVRLEHLPFTDAERLLRGARRAPARGGGRLHRRHRVLAAARCSSRSGASRTRRPPRAITPIEHIYYRSIRERREDYLTVRDFIWRWDTDWFWCSKNLLAQNPLVRRLAYGRKRLGSRTYTKIMRWNSRVGLTKKLERLAGLHSESVIQDVDIPLERAAEFLAFYAREIGLWPQWICPIGPAPHSGAFTLYPMRPGWYVNFGFWDMKRTREAHPRGHFNRLIEEKVGALGGIKSLYSESFFPEDEFRRIYGGEAYAALKRKYDPQGAFPGLYEKCVLRR